MKLARIDGELEVLGVNAAMKRVLRTPQPPSLRLELQMVPPVITTPQGRERLAEFIVRGNGRAYSREEIKTRIQKVARRIARKMEAGE